MIEMAAGRQTGRRWVGRVVPDVYGRAKVTGRERYPIDVRLPGLVHVRTVRSQIPHGYLRRLDTARAQAMPGVLAVFTADVIQGTNRFGAPVADQPVLVPLGGKIRMVGDALALVVAETEAAAERAVGLVEVGYEELEAVTDSRAALAPGAPLVHEDRPGNLCAEATIRRGDVARGFAEAEVVVEHEFVTQRQEHAYMEPEAGVAVPEADGTITVYAGTQAPLQHRGVVSQALGIPEEQIRLVPLAVGGAFGGKMEVSVHVHLALVAQQLGRPVRMAWGEEESFLASTKRHPAIIKIRLGAKREGTLTALEVDSLLDGGAYACSSKSVVHVGIGYLCGPYRISNVAIRGRAAFTNNPMSSAMRGFGGPQSAFAIETAMNMLAERLGQDRIELRLQNAVRQGDESPNPVIKVHAPVSLPQVFRRALELVGEPLHAASSRERVGRGISCTMPVFDHGSGFIADMPRTSVDVEWLTDGTVLVRTEAVEFGEGTATALCQIVADELGVSPHDVGFVQGDTAAVPASGRGVASRQIYCVGNATLLACRRLRDQLREYASKAVEAPPEAIEFVDGAIVVQGKHERRWALKEFVREQIARGARFAEQGVFQGDRALGDLGHTFCAAVFDVAVDIQTGKVRILQAAAVGDAGCAINPAKVLGQLSGGEAQGIGFALMEDMSSEDGRILTPTLMQYLLPTTLDVAEVGHVDFIEEPYPTGPYGARGVGEHGTKDVAPGIVDAIHDAVGVWIDELPATPERVWRAMQYSKKREGVDQDGVS